MNETLKLGFVPLTDAAPLIVAQALGFFRDEGLPVELVREVSWATVRDKLAVGALDGAHLLSPLALASTSEGKGGAVVAPFVLNRGGAAITLSARLAAREDAAGGLRRLVAMRREQGSSPITLAVVFPHSLHALLLRRWLAEAQLDPQRDVLITVAPPSRMAELLEEGVIEGFCAGEPWNTAAVATGAGQVVARAGEIWPGAADKLMALRAERVAGDAGLAGAVVRALQRGADWAAAREHRGDLAELLAGPGYVGVATGLLTPGFDDVCRAGADVNAPQESDAVWLVGQMGRAGLLAAEPAAAAARRLFRRDLYEAAFRVSA